MPESLLLVAYLVGLFVFAAAVLWIGERLAKLIGSRNMWFLVLIVVPAIFSVATTAHNWNQLDGWQRVWWPLLGPAIAVGVIFLGFAALNPADAFLLFATLIRKAWRWVHRARAPGDRES